MADRKDSRADEPPSPIWFAHERQAAFADADPAGILHFTRLLAYVEEAEHAWLRAAGVSLLAEGLGWPRVQLAVDFQRPVPWQAELRIELQLQRCGRRSATFDFRLGQDRAHLAGSWTIVHARLVDGLAAAVDLPADFTAHLQAATPAGVPHLFTSPVEETRA